MSANKHNNRCKKTKIIIAMPSAAKYHNCPLLCLSNNSFPNHKQRGLNPRFQEKYKKIFRLRQWEKPATQHENFCIDLSSPSLSA